MDIDLEVIRPVREAVLERLSEPIRQVAGVPVWVVFALASHRELERLRGRPTRS